VLVLDVEEQIGIRHQRVLEADQVESDAPSGEEGYTRWNEARSIAIAVGSRPSIAVQTATKVASGGELVQPSVPQVTIETVQRVQAGRPSGRRFGALVHTVLAAVDLDAAPDEVGAIAQVNGRLLDAIQEEVDAAITAVKAALMHPLIRRAAASAKAGLLRRETPVQLQRHDGTLIEGVVDLAFREQSAEFDGWSVVDFKTDRDMHDNRERYVTQVVTYVQAITRATRLDARGFLLIV
jgi:ATP-dependent exoDNAse (exonuclease V) beta subunit